MDRKMDFLGILLVVIFLSIGTPLLCEFGIRLACAISNVLPQDDPPTPDYSTTPVSSHVYSMVGSVSASAVSASSFTTTTTL